MESYLIIAAICTIIALLVNAPLILHERRLRKLASAKLEVTKTVNEINQLMLTGEIKMGELCHDKVYPIMLSTQYDGRFYATWKLWKPPTEASKNLRLALHQEITKGTPLGNILNRFASAKFSCFRRQQPLMFYCFSIWVLFVAGGFLLLLMGVVSAITARVAWRNFRQRFALAKLNQLLSEWSLILAGSPGPQFKQGT